MLRTHFAAEFYHEGLIRINDNGIIVCSSERDLVSSDERCKEAEGYSSYHFSRWQAQMIRSATSEAGYVISIFEHNLAITMLCSLVLAVANVEAARPWMNASLTVDERVKLLLPVLSLDEKVAQTL